MQGYLPRLTRQILLEEVERGGKEKEIPVHHKLEEILDAYLKASKLGERPEAALFPTTLGKSRELGSRPMTRIDRANPLKSLATPIVPGRNDDPLKTAESQLC